MNRRQFISIAGGAVVAGGAVSYLLSDRSNLVRSDLQPIDAAFLKPDEKEILFLASLAPSGHNTQPWFVQYLEPYHWIIGNDKSKWLPAVDPTQREIILSIGAFVQNLKYAAGSFGYSCDLMQLAANNQDERVLEVKLVRKGGESAADISRIRERRTLRSEFLTDPIKKEDLDYLSEPELFRYIPSDSREGQFINEQTIEANRLQAYREPAQEELAAWLRFSSRDAEKHRDGMTTAALHLDGIAGWYVRNFFDKDDVMKPSFRERGIDMASKAVAGSAGWIVITSKNESTSELLETGKRLQRLLLKVRERNIAIHPMSQALEESATQETIKQSIGAPGNIQFLLRTGYAKEYPPPVSLRRPVSWFVRS